MSSKEVQKVDVFSDADLCFNVSEKDISFPYFKLLQGTSGEVQMNDPRYIKGACSGMIANTITGKLYSSMVVTPVNFRSTFVEWKPKNKGGGFVKAHTFSILESCTRDEKGGFITPDGNNLVQSNDYVVLAIDGEDFEAGIISLKGGQLKKARAWNTLISTSRAFDPATKTKRAVPAFYFTYNIKTISESGVDKNGTPITWGSWHFTQGQPVLDLPKGAEIYSEAKRLYKMLESKEVFNEVDPFEDEKF